jgi:exodeoxyribonuclease V gamma subunit
VLVGELCDYLGADSSAGALEAGDPTGIIVRHPLQAFSPRYFDASDARLFSHAVEYLEGARTHGVSRSKPPEFFSEPLEEPESPDAIALGDLVRFYQNPTEYLLNRRLELSLREGDFEIPNREPQELSGLELFWVGDHLLALMLRGVPLEQARRLIAASGALPLGTPGELDFARATASAAPIAARVIAARSGERRPPLVLDQRLPSGVTLSGTLPESFAGSIIESQFARVSPRHLIGAWIRHLAWCTAAPSYAAHTSLFGRPEEGDGVQEFRFRTVVDAAARLDVLAAHFRTGQTLPLPFLRSCLRSPCTTWSTCAGASRRRRWRTTPSAVGRGLAGKRRTCGACSVRAGSCLIARPGAVPRPSRSSRSRSPSP